MNEFPHVTPRPHREFVYQGPLIFVLGLFVWAIAGHVAIVIHQEESGALEYIYLITAILCAMALNNRWHGINHRIKFFADHMVVPKLFNPWFWREQIIYYNDIVEIKSYGDDHAHQAQMHLVTSGPIYPILARRLQGVDLSQLKQHILEFAKGHQIATEHKAMPFEVVQGQDSKSGQKFLMIAAVLISVLTIGAIISAGPFLSVLDGTRFFVAAFFLSIIQTTALARMSAQSGKPDNTGAKQEAAPNWHRRFLLAYLGLYGVIAWAFGLIAINGSFDRLPAERHVVQVVNTDQVVDQEGPFCFEFTWVTPQAQDPTRLPASESEMGPRPLDALCRKGPALAKAGEKLVLFRHRGALGEPWVSTLAPMSGETVE